MVSTGRIKPVGHGPDESLFQKCSRVFRASYYLEGHLLKLSALQLNTKVLLKSKQLHTEQVKSHEDITNNAVGGRELDSIIQPRAQDWHFFQAGTRVTSVPVLLCYCSESGVIGSK